MRNRLLGLLAATALVVSACGGSTSTAAPAATSQPAATTAPAATEAPTPEPTATPENPEDVLFAYTYEPTPGTPGGSAVVGDWQAVANLNSFYDNSFTTSQVLASTMVGLWETSSDGHWKPELAAKMPKFSDDSIRQAADGSFEVDLELLPDLKWSDGTPLTLNDLKYTWKWVMDPAQSGLVSGTTGWEDITDIVVSDDGLKATVKFSKPYAGFYGLLGSWFLPEHYFSTIPVAEAATKSMPVSPDIIKVPASGPFMFDTASPTGIVVKKNPNYKLGSSGNGAYLDEVKFNFYADVDGMKADFLAGNVDAALDMLAADYDSIKGVDPAIGRALLEPAWQYEHLDMNQGANGHPMLKDPKVRQALTQAIDKADLFSALFPGYPVPETAACSPAPPGTYWRDETITCPPYDVAAANALLDEAGWVDSNGDGTRDKDGVEAVLKAYTLAGRPVRQLTLEKVAGYFDKIGVKVEVGLNDILFDGWNDTTADTEGNIYRGTYDLALFAWVLTFDLFGNYYYSYHCDQFPDEEPHDGGNTSRFCNPEMDAALDVLKNKITTADQVEAARTVQKVFVEQFAEIPLYYRNEARGVSTRLQNFFKNPGTASDIWNVEDWWVQQ
jgi:peptide/nickel transport system substrate-binding protein